MKAYTFKVSLLYAKRIYRRIACLGGQTLDDFHQEIFRAFDRYDEHLYSFYFPTRTTSSMKIIRRSAQYSHPMALTGMTYHPQFDATDIKIEDIGLIHGQKFYYLFDYGDEWWHEITFQGITELNEKVFPATLSRAGDSPDQYPDIEE